MKAINYTFKDEIVSFDNYDKNKITAGYQIYRKDQIEKISIDPYFNVGSGFNGTTRVVCAQSDEKVIVGGEFTTFDSITRNRIIRLNVDGTIDNSFNVGDGFNNTVFSIIIQNDGKILIGGQFTSYNSVTYNRIIRLNTDGTVDSSFNSGGSGFNGTVLSINLQNDGKILIGGEFTSYNGTTINRIIRLNTDGSIDNSFNIGTGFNDATRAIIIQNDGKILIGGSFTSYNGVTTNRIVRLNSDGNRDTNFDIGVGFNSIVRVISLQNDGKILIGGDFTTFVSISTNRIVRLNTNGSIDNSFIIETGFNGVVWSIIPLNNGNILIGGEFQSYKSLGNFTTQRIVLLNSIGDIISSFSSWDIKLEVSLGGSVFSIFKQNNKFFIAGQFTTYSNRILRLETVVDDSFIGPLKLEVTMPNFQSAVAQHFVSVVTFSDTIDWVFYLQNTTLDSRRIFLYEHNKINNQYDSKGFILWTRLPSGTHTHRGFKMSLENYSEGTASVNGTSVTGTLTEWINHNIPSGCRIGFGSKVPSEINTWFEISSINSNTSITLTSSAGNLNSVDYVIQDLRAIIVTSATGVVGGTHLIKGLNYDTFTTGATITSATNLDSLRRTYKLNGETTNALNNPVGLGLADRTSWTEHNLYVPNVVTTTTVEVFVFNIRASLNPSSGIDNNAFQFRTGIATVFTTIQQNNSACLFTVRHGIAKDQPSLYFISTNRVYRAPLELIKRGSIDWIQDYMAENPPGSSTTYTLPGFNNLSYCSMSDRIFLSGGARNYYTKYNTSLSTFDSIFLSDSKTVNNGTGIMPINPDTSNIGFIIDINSGFLHILRNTTTLSQNVGYSIPLSTHQNFAFGTNSFLISPVFRIPEGNFVKMIPQYIRRLGNHPSAYFQPEPFRIFYRTKGITNNTGDWTRLNDSGDLTNVFDNQIQFAFTFKTLGAVGIPPRLKGILLTYENLMDYYKPSKQKTESENYIISWRQDKLFTSNIPKISVNIFDIKTSLTIIEDDTISNNLGVWEYSENYGQTWNPWDDTKNQIGNLIRYKTTNLPKGIKLKVILK